MKKYRLTISTQQKESIKNMLKTIISMQQGDFKEFLKNIYNKNREAIYSNELADKVSYLLFPHFSSEQDPYPREVLDKLESSKDAIILSETATNRLKSYLDTVSRAYLGQFSNFLLLFKGQDGWLMDSDLEDDFQTLLKNHGSCRFGILNEIGESDILFTIMQCVRHRLAWDGAIDKGITDGTCRDWGNGMMFVDFDDPVDYRGGFIEIERIE